MIMSSFVPSLSPDVLRIKQLISSARPPLKNVFCLAGGHNFGQSGGCKFYFISFCFLYIAMEMENTGYSGQESHIFLRVALQSTDIASQIV